MYLLELQRAILNDAHPLPKRKYAVHSRQIALIGSAQLGQLAYMNGQEYKVVRHSIYTSKWLNGRVVD
jgi:hypothetical protein